MAMATSATGRIRMTPLANNTQTTKAGRAIMNSKEATSFATPHVIFRATPRNLIESQINRIITKSSNMILPP